ncbi:MAG TPA: peptidylprolyl isomerase [Mycobacteriales bacterium]|nr:peptidylprolyl isomerase [Mycobacteriales bacterium]
MIRRSVPLVLAALLLTGCAGTGVGVAARVGDSRIATSELADRVGRGYENKTYAQSHPKDEFQRQWLNRLIEGRLVETAARRLKVTITEAQVDAQLKKFYDSAGGREQFETQVANQGGIAPSDLREATRELVLRDAVADKLVEDVEVTDAQLKAAYRQALPQLDTAHIAHIVVKDAKTAAKVAAEAKAPGADFAALAKTYSLDVNTNAEGGDLGRIGNGDGKFEASFEKKIFAGTSSGSIVGPVKAASGFEIVKVIERTTTSFEAAREDLRRAVIGQARDEKLGKYLQDLSHELGVKVNPRFGTWNPQTGEVTATAGDDLSSPAPSPGDGQGGGVLPGSAPGGAPGGAPPGSAPTGGAPAGGTGAPTAGP